MVLPVMAISFTLARHVEVVSKEYCDYDFSDLRIMPTGITKTVLHGILDMKELMRD